MLKCIYPLISDATIPPVTATTTGLGDENAGE